VIQVHQEMINFEESGADAKEEVPKE
jgi:hypothetical protein